MSLLAPAVDPLPALSPCPPCLHPARAPGSNTFWARISTSAQTLQLPARVGEPGEREGTAGLGLFGNFVVLSCSNRRTAARAQAWEALAFESFLHRGYLQAVSVYLQETFLQVAWLELLNMFEFLEAEEHMGFVVAE